MPAPGHLKDLQKKAEKKIGFVGLEKFLEYDGSVKKHFDVGQGEMREEVVLGCKPFAISPFVEFGCIQRGERRME